MDALSRSPAYFTRGGDDGEVVAGLANDGSALAVAVAAVREAVSRGVAIRFVQVLPDTVDAEASAQADASTFRAALTALRGHPRTRSTFEVVRGNPQRVLVQRSRRASVLVVGEDRPTSDAAVAQYCREHATCAVRTVGVLG